MASYTTDSIREISGENMPVSLYIFKSKFGLRYNFDTFTYYGICNRLLRKKSNSMSRQTQNTKRYNVFIFFIQRGNTNRMNRILPPCEYTVSTDLQRLSTFSKLTDQDVTHKISAVRLAASGCVYNADEGYIECTGCAKVSMLNNGI